MASRTSEKKMDDGIDENGLTLSAIIVAGFTLHFFWQFLDVLWKHTNTKHTVGWLTYLHNQHPASYRCSLVINSVALAASLLIILLRIAGWWRFKPGSFLWEMRLLFIVAITAFALLFLVSSPLLYL